MDEFTKYLARTIIVASSLMVYTLYADHVSTEENTAKVEELKKVDKEQAEEMETLKDRQDSLFRILHDDALRDSVDKADTKRQLKDIQKFMLDIKKALG